MLQTPVIAFKKKDKLVRWAYNISDAGVKPGETPNYKKGLGSWDADELKEIINHDGLSAMIVPLDFDSDESDLAIEEWLGDDSTPRKEHILKTDFSIANI